MAMLYTTFFVFKIRIPPDLMHCKKFEIFHRKKMAAFSLRLDLAEEVTRHFLENDYGDLSFFFCRFELSSKFLYVK